MRLLTLQECGILDTPAEPHLDQLTAFAAEICGAPVAILGFLDQDRYWIKSRFRWNVSQFPREAAFARFVVDANDVVLIEDAQKDPRAVSNPLVTAPPNVRFYAGAPIVTSDGMVVGSLEVFDRVPRQLQNVQVNALRTLAREVGAELDLRRRLERLDLQLADTAEVREALRESDERFQDLFDSADDMIMSIRSDGRLMHLNRAAIETLAGADGTLHRPTIEDAIHPDALPDFNRMFQQIIRTGVAETVETEFLAADGRRLIVEGSLIPKVVNGSVILARVIFRDITERKMSEIELGKARDEALESSRAKSQFLTNITHEIRTPMNVILGMLQLLGDSTTLTAEQRDYVQTAQGSAETLLGIINNILHVSQLESGKLSITLADFDLRSSVQRIVDVMNVVGMERKVTIRAEVDEDIPPIVRGDVARLRQVLTNLLGNAIKFSGESTVRIGVRGQNETDSHYLIRFEITDHGVGIPENAIPRIFDPFFQVDSSSTREHSGTGLGLTTSKQLVEIMGGQIGVTSEEGIGSTFWFTVPFQKKTAERITVTAMKSGFPGMRALIVDRSETSRKVLSHIFASWGMRTRAAGDYTEALERLRSEASLGEPYRIAVFDRQLVEIDGIGFARLVKADPSIASTGLVMMIPLGEIIDDSKARAAGIGAYINKPVAPSDLFDALSTVLAREMPAIDAAAGPPSEEKPVVVPPEVRERVRILLVEDKPLNRKVALGQLQNLGYRADVATNGAEAVDAVLNGDYHIVLMDCQMPVMDGYEATVEIRRKQTSANRTRIVAMTAHALQGDREKCLSAGMDDYLSKPTKQSELEAALARNLPLEVMSTHHA
ncbi:MAG: response regulator [Thermoanaerobaculia bacterium]